MRYLKIVLVIVIFPFAFTGYSQSLSTKGTAHLRAAEALLRTASSGEDYQQIAEEYEKVLVTDPSYVKAYLEAAHAYAMATPELGKATYDKGINILNRLKNRSPSYESEIYSETVVLDAMLKKYSNGPSRIYGTWGEYGHDGTFYPFVRITESGGFPDVEFLGYWMAGTQGAIKDVSIDVSANTCNLEFVQYWDDGPSLRKKGWTHFVDDCDGDADPGYPTTGKYEYDESYNTWYYKINLSDYPLKAKCEKIHSDYYCKGVHTYSGTDRATRPMDKNLKKR